MASLGIVEFTDQDMMDFPHHVPYKNEDDYKADLRSVKSGRRMYACTVRWLCARAPNDTPDIEQMKHGLRKDFQYPHGGDSHKLWKLIEKHDTAMKRIEREKQLKLEELKMQQSAYSKGQEKAIEAERAKMQLMLAKSTCYCGNHHSDDSNACMNLAVATDPTGAMESRHVCAVCYCIDSFLEQWRRIDRRNVYNYPVTVFCSQECAHSENAVSSPHDALPYNAHRYQKNHGLRPMKLPKGTSHACAALEKCKNHGKPLAEGETGYICAICWYLGGDLLGKTATFCSSECYEATEAHKSFISPEHRELLLPALRQYDEDMTPSPPQFYNAFKQWVELWLPACSERDEILHEIRVQHGTDGTAEYKGPRFGPRDVVNPDDTAEEGECDETQDREMADV